MGRDGILQDRRGCSRGGEPTLAEAMDDGQELLSMFSAMAESHVMEYTVYRVGRPGMSWPLRKGWLMRGGEGHEGMTERGKELVDPISLAAENGESLETPHKFLEVCRGPRTRFNAPLRRAPCMPQCFHAHSPSIQSHMMDGMSPTSQAAGGSPPARMLQNKPAAHVCESLATPTAIELVDNPASPTTTSPYPIVPCHLSDLSSPHPTSTPPRPQ